ncbi:MAG: hypothetical protein WBO44_14330 [Saprospiraceae bacterium]
MDKVRNILKSYITEPKGQDWCDDIIQGDEDSKRLAICLAVELRKGGEEIINVDHLKLLFDSCDYDTSNFLTDKSFPRNWFSKRLDSIKYNLRNLNGSIVASNELILESRNTNHYVTLLSFYRLKKYYLDSIGYYSSVDSNNSNEIESFINLFPNLLDYIDFFGDKNYPIWVSTFEEYQTIRSTHNTVTFPTNIINSLGIYPDTAGLAIYPDTGNMLFLVDYGPSLKITAYQPTSLNKNWTNCQLDFYLSYIKDNCFGKTCACNNSFCGSKEQIHEQIKCKDSGFTLSYLGKFNSITSDKVNILIEGLNRIEL